jgi:hypothetical protein
MILETSKRDRLIKILNKAENQDFIRKLAALLIILIPCYTGDEFNICIMLIKIVPFVLLVASLLGPYLMLLIAFEFQYPTIIIYLSLICSLFFSISLLGIFGKGMICCLVYPCNWFLVMLFSDLIAIAGEIIILSLIHVNGVETNDYGKLGICGIFGNIVVVFAFLIQHSIVYNRIDLVFTAIRTMEMEVIYYGTHKYLECEV